MALQHLNFKTRFAPGSLKARLTAAVVVLVAISSVLVAAVALEIASRDSVEATGDQQFNLLMSAAAHLEAELMSKRILLQAIGEEISRNPEGVRTLQNALTKRPSLHASFSNVVILDANGWIRADMTNPSDVGRGPYSSRSYFKDTLRLRGGVVSQPIISALSGKPVVLITEPVFNREGKISHVIAGGINLADPQFFGQLRLLHAGSTGYLFAITKSGLILHHPDLSRLTRNVTQEPGGVVPSTRAAMDGWEGWQLANNKRGELGVLTYKQMTRSEWILGSFFPANEAFAGIGRARGYAWVGAITIALLSGVIGWAIILYLLKPLRALKRHVHAVEAEQAEISVFDVARNDEVGALGRAFHSLSLKREQAERHLQSLSETDSLTGLGNRRQFDGEVIAATRRAEEMAYSVAIGFLDVDHFKLINDTYGHAVGDFVLKEFASRLKASLRPRDRAFRLAGDEFVLILEGIDSPESVKRLATRLIQKINMPFEYEGKFLAVTTSIGLVISGSPIAQVGDLLQHADAALYKAKRAGRNGYALKELGRKSLSNSR